MKMLCECDSIGCRAVIELPDSVVDELAFCEPRPVLIAEDCPHGPEPSDRLVEQRDGYAIYMPR